MSKSPLSYNMYLPNYLFANNTALESCKGFISQNRTDWELTVGLIFQQNTEEEQTKYTKLNDLSGMFQVSHITALPQYFFSNTPSIKYLNWFCTSAGTYEDAKGKTKGYLTNIPGDLLNDLTKLEQLAHVFHNNPHLKINGTEQIPIDFLTCTASETDSTSLTDCSYLFTGCKEITCFADESKINNFIPDTVTDIAQIFAVTNLGGSVHLSLFKDKKALTNVSSALRGTQITGEINNSIFEGCENLADVSEVFRDCV